MAEERRELKQAVRYLGALRVLVQRAAAEHAAWARFMGGTAAVMRAEPGLRQPEHADIAARYARAFAARRGQLAALAPAPAACGVAHEEASGWLESLERLAEGAAAAIARSAGGELDVLVRAAGEPGRRLKRLQRTYAQTTASLRSAAGGLRPTTSSPPSPKRAPRPAAQLRVQRVSQPR